MAFFASTVGVRPSIFHTVAEFFRALGVGIDLAANSNDRILEMEKLNALTDAELDAKGLRREDIARYVFRDVLHF